MACPEGLKLDSRNLGTGSGKREEGSKSNMVCCFAAGGPLHVPAAKWPTWQQGTCEVVQAYEDHEPQERFVEMLSAKTQVVLDDVVACRWHIRASMGVVGTELSAHSALQ